MQGVINTKRESHSLFVAFQNTLKALLRPSIRPQGIVNKIMWRYFYFLVASFSKTTLLAARIEKCDPWHLHYTSVSASKIRSFGYVDAAYCN
jgi:hypothetical protein